MTEETWIAYAAYSGYEDTPVIAVCEHLRFDDNPVDFDPQERAQTALAHAVAHGLKSWDEYPLEIHAIEDETARAIAKQAYDLSRS